MTPTTVISVEGFVCISPASGKSRACRSTAKRLVGRLVVCTRRTRNRNAPYLCRRHCRIQRRAGVLDPYELRCRCWWCASEARAPSPRFWLLARCSFLHLAHHLYRQRPMFCASDVTCHARSSSTIGDATSLLPNPVGPRDAARSAPALMRFGSYKSFPDQSPRWRVRQLDNVKHPPAHPQQSSLFVSLRCAM